MKKIIQFRLENILDSLNLFNAIENISKTLIMFLNTIFPVLLFLTTVTLNLTIIIGAITYLLEYNERNGKVMIYRSVSILIVMIIIFNPNFSNFSTSVPQLMWLEPLTSFLTSYFLFIFASLSLIIFVGNLGLYLLSSDKTRIKIIKKSGFCFVSVLIPLGFQFPVIPEITSLIRNS